MANSKTLASMLIEGLKTVKVCFNNETKKYTYKTMDDLEIDDLVIILGPRGDFKIAKVSSVDKIPDLNPNSNKNYKWIVQKIDLTKFNELNKLEEEFADDLRELEQKSIRDNAKLMLSENFGIKPDKLNDKIKYLNDKV